MTDNMELSVVASRVGDDTFDVTHYAVRGWQLFVVRGDIRGAACDMVLDRLTASVESGATRLIVDLSRVNAVEPQCVQALAGLDRQLRSAGGDLRLVVDGVAVLQAIRLAGLSGRFEIHRYVGDIAGAVAGIDEGGRGRRRGALQHSNIGLQPTGDDSSRADR